jgi:aquaporin Z
LSRSVAASPSGSRSPLIGTSVNPARSIGGVASNPHALLQLWLFIVAPLTGAAAGFLFCEVALLTPPSSSTSS